MLAGLGTGLGALPVLALRSLSRNVLNTLLGASAGVMLFVISDEIIPETHALGKSRQATYGVLIGFVIMMALDNLLG